MMIDIGLIVIISIGRRFSTHPRTSILPCTILLCFITVSRNDRKSRIGFLKWNKFLVAIKDQRSAMSLHDMSGISITIDIIDQIEVLLIISLYGRIGGLRKTDQWDIPCKRNLS